MPPIHHLATAGPNTTTAGCGTCQGTDLKTTPWLFTPFEMPHECIYDFHRTPAFQQYGTQVVPTGVKWQCIFLLQIGLQNFGAISKRDTLMRVQIPLLKNMYLPVTRFDKRSPRFCSVGMRRLNRASALCWCSSKISTVANRPAVSISTARCSSLHYLCQTTPQSHFSNQFLRRSEKDHGLP